MPRLLPPIPDHDALLRIRDAAVDYWRPALHEIARRHEFSSHAVTRFANGDNPVFACDDAVVVKLVPPLWPAVAGREVALLASLPAHTAVSAPRLLGHGEIDDWHYLVSTRLPGEGVDVIWLRLTRVQQEELAHKFGAMLHDLHAVPAEAVPRGTFPDWNTWVQAAVANWTTRRDLHRLPPGLRADGNRFLGAAGLGDLHESQASWCRLHGDLAPINALAAVNARDGVWQMSGMIDFGNAGFGDPVFDYTAPTVLLQPGDAGIIQHFLAGVGIVSTKHIVGLRTRLMAYTLIHPMADLGDCLDLIPAARTCATWDDVARLFWPAPP